MQVDPDDHEDHTTDSKHSPAPQRLVAEAVGDVIGFWNFKPSMGRVWAALYLAARPLTSAEIVDQTGLSVGSVSMTLSDLRKWGVVREAGRSGGRRVFEAETDVVRMVTRVLQERELVVVRSSVAKLQSAIGALNEASDGTDAQTAADGQFAAGRAQLLLELAVSGEAMLEQFVRVGQLDLGNIENKLTEAD